MRKRVSPFLALRYPNFRYFWIGLLISSIGTQMQVVGVTWHIYSLTHSAFSLGLIGLFRFLPLLLFSQIGGMLADSLDRKKLIFLNQILMSGFSLILALMTFTNSVNPFFIYLTIALLSLTQAIDAPARHALTPHLLPREYFMNAVSLNTLMWQTSIVIGPSIAGFIIAYLGVGSVYLINSLSFFAVVTSLLFIHVPHLLPGKKPDFNFSGMIDGIRFIIKTPIISSTMLLDFIATFFSVSTTLLPIFAKDILMVGPKGLGLLYASSSFGAVLAGLLFSSFHHVRNQGKVLLLSVFFYGISTVLFGFSRSFYLSLLFLALSGAGDVVSTIIRNTIRQMNTPDHLRGRTTAINMVFYTGGPQLGEIEAGIVAGFWGAPFAVITGGAATILATIIISISIPHIRKYHGDEITL